MILGISSLIKENKGWRLGMTSGFSAFTHSKYYHPSFNSAIFDGPLRIYFVQFHESYALNIYFSLQERFKEALNKYKETAKKIDKTLLIMIYPTEDSFLKAFSEARSFDSSLARIDETSESILGLLAPISEHNVSQLMDELSDIFIRWERQALAQIVSARSPEEWPSESSQTRAMSSITEAI